MKDFSRHPIRTPLSLYRSFRFFKFFSAKSFYLSRSFLARFLSLYRLFPFSNFFFPKYPKYLFQFFLIFFKFSFTNSYLLRFFFVRFLSPYRFLPFSKPFFANYPNYLSRFFLIFQIPFYKLVFIAISLRFLSLYRFFPSIFQLLFRKVSEAFIASFPPPFSFLSYRFSASLFLARFHLRGHPTSASKSSISIVVPPQKRFSPPPDSSLRDSLARRPP